MRKNSLLLLFLLLPSFCFADIFGGVGRLQDLEDVSITSVADDNLLQYDSATSKWTNTTLSTIGDSTYLKLDTSNDPLTGALTINTNSTTALLVEQDGVKDNVLIVDTTNAEAKITGNLRVINGYIDVGGQVGQNPSTASFQGFGIDGLGVDWYYNNAQISTMDTTGGWHIQTDNAKLTVGAGDDASVYYDGTNMLINPKEVGTGYLDILGKVNADNFVSDVITGTQPYACTSTTLNTNLNADLWDGYQFADYLDQAVKTTSSPTFANLVITAGGDIRPSANSTTALNIAQANGTDFVTFDTTNKNVGIGTTTFGTSAAVNLALGGSATLGAATADIIHLAAVDFAAGDRRLAIQSELGLPMHIGNDMISYNQIDCIIQSAANSSSITLRTRNDAGATKDFLFNKDGIFITPASFRVYLDGSDSVGSGANLYIANTANTRAWVTGQLTASNHLDMWYYNGTSWTQMHRFENDGDVLLGINGGNVGIGTSSPDRLLHAETSTALTNTVSYAERLSHITSGVPANNIGVGLEFEVETAANNNEVGVTIEAVAVDTTATSEDFDIVFKNMTAGAAVVETARITSLGAIVLKSITADPTSPADGSIWYRSDLSEFRCRANSVTYKLVVQGI